MMVAEQQQSFRGELRRDEPMSRHTSWRVGGPAEWFFKPQDEADLALFLRQLDPGTPLFWFGLGSNLLVRDGGIAGVVIATAGAFDVLERTGDLTVRVGASVPCTQLARQCIRWNLGPSEFFAGIPGTVGGALAMNAGAHGGETWERVSSVRCIDSQGDFHERTPADYEIAYRSVRGPENEWFIEAELEFEAGVEASMETMKSMLERRKETQPLGLPSCGSVFRNPPGDFAARLIESCELKGCRIGDAEISEKHANFIINRGEATALDIENLIRYVQQTVADMTGIELEHEVRIVGREVA
jgi:UDP-N-acetylmuramate dehydrogenase